MSDTSQRYYITTAIPYVNAKPHLGHVLEWFQADVLARYHRLLGHEVAFASGADENSLKNVQAAEKAGLAPQAWLDQYSEIFKEAYAQFDISLTSFRRGSDQEKHWPGVQELWRLCEKAGDIYKKTYTGLYCIGCESFYTAEELVEGKCPEHLTVPERVKEENYFFRLSKYQAKIKELIESDDLRIVSAQYKNEMLGFINKGLEDFSVSRSTKRARGLGVPVPNDPDQIMYVWFDALSIYLTAIGWGYDTQLFTRFWPANAHVIGKGINRFHSVYWIGMLLSGGLPTPRSVSVHGYITVNGQKMSKSIGNVIDPVTVIEQYGLEPIRYYLLKEVPTHSDGDFSHERFRELYQGDLANGLGNLCSRVAKLCERSANSFQQLSNEALSNSPAVRKAIEDFELKIALELLQQELTSIDQQLNHDQPWKLNGDAQFISLQKAVFAIQKVSYFLQPFLPKTAGRIFIHFSQPKISALAPLFPRLD